MFVYFSLVLLKSLWDLVRGSKIRLSSGLLLWFEVLYGMAWLVDAMYWIFLVPYDAIKEGSEGLARRTTRLSLVKGGWTYFFLDFNRDDAVPYLLLLQVVVVLSFGLGALLSLCMESLHTRRYAMAKDASPVSEQDDAFRGVEMQPEPAYLGA
eukprot:s1735_g3.t1